VCHVCALSRSQRELVGETAGCVAQQLNSAALSWCDDRGIRSSVVGRDKAFFSTPKTGFGVAGAGGGGSSWDV